MAIINFKSKTWSTCFFFFLVSTVPFLPSPMAVGVMNALSRSNRKPRTVRTIVIHHMPSPNPNQLMALVQIQLRHCRLVPPILLLPIAATLPSNIRRRNRRWTLAAVDLKAFVWCYERRMGPICLHPTTLRCPIIGVPYWTIYTHGLILRKGYASVLQIRMNSDRSFIHEETDQNSQRYKKSSKCTKFNAPFFMEPKFVLFCSVFLCFALFCSEWPHPRHKHPKAKMVHPDIVKQRP